MSNTIFPKFEDPRITQIRESVKSRTDAIPFLLLPVRMETRFMKVPRQADPAMLTIEKLLEAIGHLHFLVLDAIQALTVAGVQAATAEVNSIIKSLPSLAPLSLTEKGWAKQLLADVKPDISALTTKGGSALAIETAKLNEAFIKLTALVEGLQATKQQILPEVSQGVQDSSVILSKWSGVNGGVTKIPYYNIKNKKTLYNYISGLLDETTLFYAGIETQYQGFEFIDKNQLTRLIQIHERIVSELNAAKVKVPLIHGDTSWKKFAEVKVAPKLQELITASAVFNTKILPKLKTLPPPPALKTGELFFHGMQTFTKLRKFNEQVAIKNYDPVKRFKTYLAPRINTLAKVLQKPVEESKPGQRTALSTLYNSINSELNITIQKINTLVPQNESQAFGLKAIQSFFKNDAVKAITGFTAPQSIAAFPQSITGTEPLQLINQLWVRIYPDDIFVKTHEPALTQTELASGKEFWKLWWAASDDNDLEISAWKTLCAAMGSKRASWVARVLNPKTSASVKNIAALQAKPSENVALATATLNIPLQFFRSIPVNNTSLEFFQNFATLDMEGAFGNFNIAINNLLNVQTPQQDYLVEKLKTVIAAIVPFINTFLGKIAGLTAQQKTQFNTQISTLNIMAGPDWFGKIQTLFNAIKIINRDDFLSTLQNPFDYPNVQLKDSDWTEAPQADSLPDRFVVITMKGSEFSHIVVGNPVPAKLQMGLDPKKFNNASIFSIDVNGNLVIDDELKWMADYDEAVKKGMGITLELTEQQFKDGFDRVIVLGVRNADAATSKQMLEDLLSNHIYSADGMSFLKIGTPTNNTQHSKSFLEQNGDIEGRYDIEIDDDRYNKDQPNKLFAADGKVLTDALGINHGILQYANFNKNLEIANGFVVNRALWGAGLGNYLEEMGDDLFNYDNIKRTEEFYTNHVLGRGTLPSLQIGTQPYGILPTTAFSRLALYDKLPDLTRDELVGTSAASALPAALENKLQQRFEMRLFSLLKALNIVWTSLRNQNVIYSANLHNGDPQQRFVQMLGLHATSLDYFYRYSLNVAKGPNPTNAPGTQFKSNDAFGPEALSTFFHTLIFQGVYTPSFNFDDENPAKMTGRPKWQIDDAHHSRILTQFYASRIFEGRWIDANNDITGNLVDTIPLTDGPISKLSNFNMNYIDWLLMVSSFDMFGANDFDNPGRIPSKTLLFYLLRQSLLQAYQEAAMQIMQKEGIIDEVFRRRVGSKNIYHFRQLIAPHTYKHEYVTKWHLLFRKLTDLNGTKSLPAKIDSNPFFNFLSQANGAKSMSSYLDAVKLDNQVTGKLFNISHKVFFDKVAQVRQAVQLLNRISGADLEILMAEQVDLSTYRLDAWMLGLVDQRLKKQRSTKPTGSFLGAYGYVENLKPDNNKTVFNDADALAGFKLEQNKPVYHDPDNQGFIHAPSLNQAITAAVLRNAYKTNTEQEDVHNRLAVNISSARVRMAMNLIEGIRNGQEMGAILGFQFERGLHERYQTVELDKFIQPFRKAYPLSQKVDESVNGEPDYVSLVVNGSQMLDDIYGKIKFLDFPSGDTLATLLKKNNYSVLPDKIKNTINSAIQTGDSVTKIFDAIIEEIDRMADAFDALGDLAVSESVYQMVQGNHVRASAMLSALAQGKNLPDPQIIETNRTGTVVTHRVILNLPVAANSFTVPTGWNVNGSFRSFTEPGFNLWLGGVLGNPALIKCVLTIKDRNGNITKQNFSINDLAWQAIDLLTIPGGEHELKEVIKTIYCTKNNLFNVQVTVDFKERGRDWTSFDKSIGEILMQLDHIQNMVSNAKFAGASELITPNTEADANNPGNYNIAEFDKRCRGAFKALQALNTAIKAELFVDDVLDGTIAVKDVVEGRTDFSKIITHLTNAAQLGIPNALSLVFDVNATSQQRFTVALQHLLNILKESLSREKAATELLSKIDSNNDQKFKVEKLGEVAKTVFGKIFIAIPIYTPANAADIKAQLILPDAQKITRNDSAAMENWLQSIGRVRSRMYDVAMTRQMEDINDLKITSLQPVQFPFATGDFWLGIEYPSTYQPQGDKLSLVLLEESNFSKQTTQAGLVIDEWLEIIPGKEETTGISFHYNQPNATAPQSLLLAVTPSQTNQWEWDDLVHTIIDTVELAKNRAVEPEHIDKSMLNHVLPGVVAETNPPGITDPDGNPLGFQVDLNFANVK